MAAYGAQDDLNLDPTRLAELTDSASAVGTIGVIVLADVMEKAARELDGYVEAVYATPLTDGSGNVPELVKLWWVAITRYRLYGRRPEMDCPATIAADYERAVKNAMLAGQGKFDLPAARVQAASDPAPTGAVVVVDCGDARRRFGRDRDGHF